ncbi:LuxR C-terminal-related transcriptional regulator [Mycobacterium sp. TY815]|uniref:LuxR C-terminal-related transcriptional regulator n=1 Tax=Mycobacterium sp. TY815 TaxID=3050581 RepID=UPI0027411B4D|nr:LuxR C-terminal-related transcriptional regulator [Mycobacterium sp. TY815]MDP7705182.1 LuxR C-terminal-related transcriptional regulator [Mycobacterium sp. TY815]
MECIELAREVVSAAEKLLGSATPRPGYCDDDLDSAAVALSAVRRALNERLSTYGAAPDEWDTAQAQQIAALLVRSEHAQATVLDAVLARRAAKVLALRDALERLRQAGSTADLVERAAAEAHYMGFDRILFSRINKGLWLASSAYAGADEGFAHTLVEVGLAHPRKLTGPLLEAEMVRRGAPMVVRDPQANPRVYTELVALTQTNAYVAAPVLAWDQPIGLLHADRHERSVLVDESDRDVLGVFAEALGVAFERNLLLGKLKQVQLACSEYSRGVDALVDDVTVAVAENASISANAEPSTPAVSAVTQPQKDCGGRASEKLTRREWDVLRGLAAGKTNAQIAISLFVAEGTVKTHVKHVLRKLGAANRTDAVARYHRLLN